MLDLLAKGIVGLFVAAVIGVVVWVLVMLADIDPMATVLVVGCALFLVVLGWAVERLRL